jgi:predicted glycosyltransferase
MKQKHCLFFLGHPAHYHMFKNTIAELNQQGVRTTIMVKTKDVLTDLLDASGLQYINTLPQGRNDGIVGIIESLWVKTSVLFRFAKQNRPDLMLGTSAEIAWVGKLLGIKSLVFNEDDYKVVKGFARVVYPFASAVVSPAICDNGPWQRKTITYQGYQKLAYLHPKRFVPNVEIVQKYFDASKPYSIIRFAKLNAHHDTFAEGFTPEIASETIKRLQKYGAVFITSERPLEPEFERYRLNINPLDIHHVLAFAQLYLGDSQSMAVEAAILGTPALRFSSFAGKISVLEELEENYQLTFGIHPSHPDELYRKIEDVFATDDRKNLFAAKRTKMLNDKEDVTSFYLRTINNIMEVERNGARK